MMRKVTLSILMLWVGTLPAWAIDADTLALRSDGTDFGTSWVLTNNSYAGTYITLAAPASVTVSVNAQGYEFNSIDPFMNIVIGDAKQGWSVGATADDYEHVFDLPAGTHLIRTEYNNDGGTNRALQLNTLNISGATIDNNNTSANALNTADTYIANNRKGNATLYMPAVEEGTPIHVKLKNHAFKFGTTVPNSFTNTYLIDNPTPGSDAANFQQALVDNRFNSLAPENAGKWVSNEGTRDVLTVSYMDIISDYAADHNMGFRQHNLIWGSQQPGWVNTLLTTAVDDPGAGDDAAAAAAKADLRGEITERIQYYVEDRAQRYYEIDVYNESWHTGVNTAGSNNYWDIYGVSGIAEMYKEVQDALAAGGGDAAVFVNEFNALQAQDSDYYANWYMRHIESIQNTGQAAYSENVVTGIGIQYYSDDITEHDPARIYATMQNLAVQGLPMHLTEWGVTANESATEAQAAIILDDSTRLVFGMPGTTGITLWNLRNIGGTFASVGTLYNLNWTTRDTYDAWQAMMAEWDTDEMINVNPDGTIDFNGFYGDYEITIGSQTFDLTLGKGGENQFLFYDFTIPGDTDGDGDADIDDLVAIKNHMSDTGVGFGMGDTDGDGDVDNTDLQNVKDNFGMSVTPGPPPGLAAIPEPASLGLLGAGGLMLFGRRQRI